MTQHTIDLATLVPNGPVQTSIVDGLFVMEAQRQNTRFDRFLNPIQAYVSLPGTYRLPLRIDMNVRIDSPALYLLVGKGHVTFGAMMDENRLLTDIVVPNNKPRIHAYSTSLPYDVFVPVSVVYTPKFMQIWIDGEERYFSTREKYMKATELAEMNEAGFPIRLAGAKRTEVAIQSITVTEYGAEEPKPVRPVSEAQACMPYAPDPGAKPVLAGMVSGLSDALRQETETMDALLMGMRPMRFKRQLEKNGRKVAYVASNQGFSYSIKLVGNTLQHWMCWYIVYNCKPELWHRKANDMENALHLLAQTDPDLAARMFHRLEECVGCAERCKVRSPYSFGGQKKITCHGKLMLKMTPSDFTDARKMIEVVNAMYAGQVET